MTDKTTPSTGSEAEEPAGATPASGAIPEDPGPQREEPGATPATSDGESGKLESALKAEREARKKAEKELAALRAQRDEGSSEHERLAKRVQELETANKAVEREALVQKIVTEYSIPSVLAGRIHGETEDELRADAEALKQSLPQAQPTATPVGGPQGQPAGARTPEDWIAVLRSKR